MTTLEAFKTITSERSWYKKYDYTLAQAQNFHNRLKAGTLSVEKIEEVLLKAGYIVKQEKLWEKQTNQ